LPSSSRAVAVGAEISSEAGNAAQAIDDEADGSGEFRHDGQKRQQPASEIKAFLA